MIAQPLGSLTLALALATGVATPALPADPAPGECRIEAVWDGTMTDAFSPPRPPGALQLMERRLTRGADGPVLRLVPLGWRGDRSDTPSRPSPSVLQLTYEPR